jgi:cytidylate kinase
VSEAGRGLIVTLDGPAGAGKTSTAQEVARRLELPHLDSGALYRALTFALLEAGVAEERWPDLTVADLEALGVSLHGTREGFDVRVGGQPVAEQLRSREVTSRVSTLAQVSAARQCLLNLQRSAAEQGGLVADGRDMGSVVFPEAQVKVFLVADLEERARRRLLQEGSPAKSAEEVTAEAEAIARRDEQDSGRAISPLRKPDGAVEIDTTRLSFEEQVDSIVGLARRLTD